MIKQLFGPVLAALLMLPVVTLAQDSPIQIVQDTSNRMIDALKANRSELDSNPDVVYQLVDEIVLPYFDFETMSRWVVGKYWRDATPQQQERFVTEFRTLLVRTYAKALEEYSNETVRIPAQPEPPADAKEVSVRSEIVPASGAPIPVNYSMHNRKGGWQVYDVVIDGISIVTNYRSSITDQIRKGGIDSAIAALAERNAAAGSKP